MGELVGADSDTQAWGSASTVWPRTTDYCEGVAYELFSYTFRSILPQPPDDTARDTPKALRYFKTNAHRMRYAYFCEHGLFVGSGVVEAD